MDGFTIEDLRLVVEHSSVCYGVFHEKTSKITAPNAALRLRLEAESFSVQVVSNEHGKLHGRLEKENIPVSLQVLTGMDPSAGCLVEVYLANSKSTSDNSPTSDLIQLVDMASDGGWEWFPSLQYEFMSERFWSILGYDHREMPSSPGAWMGIIDPGDLTSATKMYNTHVATKGVAEYNCNVSYTHKQGHKVQVKCRGAVVEWLPDGSPWRLLGTHTDITEITEAVDAKARFVSRMSHEIRTPICAILNECEMLEQSASTSVIADSCDQLLALCNDILTVSKLRKPMAMAAFRSSAVVDDFFHKAVRRHSGQAQKKGLALGSHVSNVPDAPLMMDISKCNQVVDNLVSNAIKYTEPGGRLTLQLNCTLRDFPTQDGVVPLNVRDINTGAARSSRVQWQVEIAVSDTGKGIHKDDVDFVFAKFSQANSSMQGAGLGLPISKELAQLMSGDVYLKETVPGKGSTFCFTFPASGAKPIVEEPAPVTDGEESTDASVESWETTRCTIRILSADDMLTNRKIMRRRIRAIEEQLENATVEVIDAVNGCEAVRTFREEGRFDLVFMDCLMPGMDGFQASKEIHRLCDERGIHRVPVVAVTASVSTGLYEECREAGIEQVVTKPFGEMDLMPILRFAIDNNQRDFPSSSLAASNSRSTASAESSPGQVVPSLPPTEEGSAKPSTTRSYVRAQCVSPSPCPCALPSGSGGSSREGVFSFMAGSVRAD